MARRRCKPIEPLVLFGNAIGLTAGQSRTGAAKGTIKVIRVGRLLMVPVVAACAELGIDVPEIEIPDEPTEPERRHLSVAA